MLLSGLLLLLALAGWLGLGVVLTRKSPIDRNPIENPRDMAAFGISMLLESFCSAGWAERVFNITYKATFVWCIWVTVALIGWGFARAGHHRKAFRDYIRSRPSRPA